MGRQVCQERIDSIFEAKAVPMRPLWPQRKNIGGNDRWKNVQQHSLTWKKPAGEPETPGNYFLTQWSLVLTYRLVNDESAGRRIFISAPIFKLKNPMFKIKKSPLCKLNDADSVKSPRKKKHTYIISTYLFKPHSHNSATAYKVMQQVHVRHPALIIHNKTLKNVNHISLQGPRSQPFPSRKII